MLVVLYLEEGDGYKDVFTKEDVDEVEVYRGRITRYYLKVSSVPYIKTLLNPLTFTHDTNYCHEWKMIEYRSGALVYQTTLDIPCLDK
jgi:hypothetical protein